MSLDEYCSRCLAILDVRTTVADMTTGETCPNPTKPHALREWVGEHLYGQGNLISIDAQPDAFRPVATWNGDPVCGTHLQLCAEREWRQR